MVPLEDTHTCGTKEQFPLTDDTDVKKFESETNLSCTRAHR